MVIRKLILFTFLLSCVYVNADTLNISNDSLKYSIGADSRFYLSSNALNTKIISQFYSGRNLSHELRSNTSQRAIGVNRAGFEFRNGLHFGIRSEKISWSFSVSDRMFSDIKFTDDAFNLVFLGNRMYEGRTASLSNSGFRFWRYQEIKAKASFKRGRGTWEVGAALLNAHDYFSVKTADASLFTDTFGIRLDLTANAEMRRPSASSKKAFSRGTGAAVDISYSRDLSFGQLKVYAYDLGFVQFNKGQIESVDTSFTYEGFELSSLFPFSDSLNPVLSGDTLKKKFITSDSAGFVSMIPALCGISLSQQKNNWKFIETIIIRPFTYALPELRFEASRRISSFSYGFTGHLGGYNYAGVGLKAAYYKGRSTFLVDLSQVEGLILPHLTSGIVAGISYRLWF